MNIKTTRTTSIANHPLVTTINNNGIAAKAPKTHNKINIKFISLFMPTPHDLHLMLLNLVIKTIFHHET